jgi:hypothetical protein
MTKSRARRVTPRDPHPRLVEPIEALEAWSLDDEPNLALVELDQGEYDRWRRRRSEPPIAPYDARPPRPRR